MFFFSFLLHCCSACAKWKELRRRVWSRQGESGWGDEAWRIKRDEKGGGRRRGMKGGHVEGCGEVVCHCWDSSRHERVAAMLNIHEELPFPTVFQPSISVPVLLIAPSLSNSAAPLLSISLSPRFPLSYPVHPAFWYLFSVYLFLVGLNFS